MVGQQRFSLAALELDRESSASAAERQGASAGRAAIAIVHRRSATMGVASDTVVPIVLRVAVVTWCWSRVSDSRSVDGWASYHDGRCADRGSQSCEVLFKVMDIVGD